MAKAKMREIMICSFIALGLVMQASLSFAAGGNSSSSSVPEDRSGMRFLGTVGGKAFVVFPTLRRTWFEARNHCYSFGMRLGGIDSIHDTWFLVNAFRNVGHGSGNIGTWTAAKFHPPPQDFINEDTWTRPSMDSLGKYGTTYYHDIPLCLSLTVFPHPVNYWYNAAACSTKMAVLCAS